MHPRIAIPADTLTEATNIINERNAAFAPRPLIEAIIKSGGLPVILPSVCCFTSTILPLIFLMGLSLLEEVMSINLFQRRTAPKIRFHIS